MRALITIVDYLASRGFPLQRGGGDTHKTSCPLHEERDASFTIWSDHAHCFGCGWHGDLVDLIGELELPSLSGKDRTREAFRRAKELGYDAAVKPILVAARPQRHDPTERQRLAMTIALAHYREVLSVSAEGRQYLRQRGVVDPLKLPLGFSSGDTRQFGTLTLRLRSALGADWLKVATEVGLVWEQSGHERNARRMFIAEERAGQIVYYQARDVTDRQKIRYLNPASITRPIFGQTTLAFEAPVVALCEGPFDALPLHSVGFPALAILGDHLPPMIDMVPLLRHRPVAVALDADHAGDAESPKILAALSDLGVESFRFRPRRPYKDLGKWAEQEGAMAVASALIAAYDLSFFPKSVVSI